MAFRTIWDYNAFATGNPFLGEKKCLNIDREGFWRALDGVKGGAPSFRKGFTIAKEKSATTPLSFESSYGSLPDFSSAKSPVSRPAPGRIS